MSSRIIKMTPFKFREKICKVPDTMIPYTGCIKKTEQIGNGSQLYARRFGLDSLHSDRLFWYL